MRRILLSTRETLSQGGGGSRHWTLVARPRSLFRGLFGFAVRRFEPDCVSGVHNVGGALERWTADSRGRIFRQRRIGSAGAPPTIRAAVSRFVVGNLAAIAVIMVGGFWVLRSVAIAEATGEMQERVRSAGRLVQAAGLSDGILHGEPKAIRRLDDLVTSQVLSDSIVRVKLWAADGTILYSDEHALIGNRYTLREKERALFVSGSADAELSDLDEPENRFERSQGKLLEAHAPVRTPDGTELLFEIYQRFSSVSASGTRLLAALSPPLVGGVVVLLLFQVPLVWTLVQRLQRGHREREELLVNAIEATTQERRRIASGLHDGVVQDLAGVAFGLAPLTNAAKRRGDDVEVEVLRRATATLRQGVRDLRTLLLEIHPPNLEAAGLRVALSDLLSPLTARGITATLEVDELEHADAFVVNVGVAGEEAAGSASTDALIYRVAREAIRNSQKHAYPSAVSISVIREPGCTRLVVTDDGLGFTVAERQRRGHQGHLGLRLLEGIVAQANGTLNVDSVPGAGTTVTLEIADR
jgi:two-component system, NarL family, sensor kinase